MLQTHGTLFSWQTVLVVANRLLSSCSCTLLVGVELFCHSLCHCLCGHTVKLALSLLAEYYNTVNASSDPWKVPSIEMNHTDGRFVIQQGCPSARPPASISQHMWQWIRRHQTEELKSMIRCMFCNWGFTIFSRILGTFLYFNYLPLVCTSNFSRIIYFRIVFIREFVEHTQLFSNSLHKFTLGAHSKIPLLLVSKEKQHVRCVSKWYLASLRIYRMELRLNPTMFFLFYTVLSNL